MACARGRAKAQSNRDDRVTLTPVALAIRAMTEMDALAVSTWRYPGPYAIYDHEPDDWPQFLVPAYRYHAVLDGSELVAYGCFGEDGRVAGGSYPPDALDIGAGMRPDLVGQRRGKALLGMLLDFAAATYGATAFRSTVAAFNHRALALCRSVGFIELARFISAGPQPREFVILGGYRAGSHTT